MSSTGVDSKPGAVFRRRFHSSWAYSSSAALALEGMLAPRKAKLQEWQGIQ